MSSAADAWDEGYKAGWTDFYRDKKAFEDDEPDITVTLNPYRAKPICCEGGPQWGHDWNCPTLP